MYILFFIYCTDFFIQSKDVDICNGTNKKYFIEDLIVFIFAFCPLKPRLNRVCREDVAIVVTVVNRVALKTTRKTRIEICSRTTLVNRM